MDVLCILLIYFFASWILGNDRKINGKSLVNVELVTLLNDHRLGPVNLNTVNLKFHLIQTFVKIFEIFLSF